MNADSMAALSLTTRIIETDVKPLSSREAWLLAECVTDLGSLVGLNSSDLAPLIVETRIDPERVARLLNRGIALANRLASVNERGIRVTTPYDDHYPERLKDRLGTQAPMCLYYAGNVELLAQDGFGVVGSRNPNENARVFTQSVARMVGKRGEILVSGGARGIDSISMSEAYDSGGSVVGVIAGSLQEVAGVAQHREAMIDDVACFCTPYNPDSPFTVGNAMGRNKIIYGLSKVTLVIASDEGKGGTWAGATEAMNRNYGQVAIWSGGGPGNAALLNWKEGRELPPLAVESPEEFLAYEQPTVPKVTKKPRVEQLGFGDI